MTWFKRLRQRREAEAQLKIDEVVARHRGDGAGAASEETRQLGETQHPPTSPPD